jgi:hypothetical protein
MHYGRKQQLIELIKDAFVAHDDLTEFPSTAITTSSTTTQTTTSTTTTAPATTEQTLSTFKSSCSAAADRRGPHQNVIGYSIYGGNFSEPYFYRKYLKPFTDTLRTIPIRYPGSLFTCSTKISYYFSLDSKSNCNSLLTLFKRMGCKDSSQAEK